MKIDAFGRELEISRHDGEWKVFDLGSEGKKRSARDIVVPSTVNESELMVYLADLLHEHATIRHSEVKVLD